MTQHAAGDHALLADGRTAALIDPEGNVAWLCWPRIDSTPCLLAILDDDVGGCFTIAPADPGATVVARAYEPGTLLLRTTWRTGDGMLEVHDALAADDPQRLVRTVRSATPVAVAVRVALAPSAARATAIARADGTVLHVEGGGLTVAVHAAARWTVGDDGVATCRFHAGPTEQSVVFADAAAEAADAALAATRDWFARRVPAAASVRVGGLAGGTLGEETARTLVVHSAAVLAALRQRGGGIVAAPTTSLPQWPGGSRTWDYRYSWLRDTALAGLALARLDMIDDAGGLGAFIGEAVGTMPPAVLRRVDGTMPPPETVVTQLRGHRGAQPVRFGNAAADQPQLDVAGEVLELAAVLAHRDALPGALQSGAARLAAWTAAHWDEPDHGIWEIRGEPRRYTHSRVVAWHGLSRAADLADRCVIAGDAAEWRAAADAIRASLLRATGALTLHDGGGGPDSALAQVVTTGFLAPDDPRVAATLDSISDGLDRGGLLDRHRPDQDPLDEPCAPFLFPTFWFAQALARCGRDGSRHMGAAARARGALDLFGEVADPDDLTPLGNFPQVQSHAAFILAATEES